MTTDDPAARGIGSQIDRQRESVVLTDAVRRAAGHWQISNRQLSKIVGRSESSISRLMDGKAHFKRGSKSFELAVLFCRLFRSLDALMGSDDRASRSWLSTTNLILKGKPIELIQSIDGLVATVIYVDSRRAPI